MNPGAFSSYYCRKARLCGYGARPRLAAADGVVREPEAADHAGIVKVAPIENEGRLQDLLQPVEIRDCGTPATR